MKRRLLALVLVVALLSLLLPALVFADTEMVICTVSPYLVSLTIVSDGNVAYGTLALGATANTTTADLDQGQYILNDGTVAADYTIKSGDAYGTPTKTWDLVTTTPGYNEFKHEWSTTGGPPWTAMAADNNYSTFVGPVSPEVTILLDLQITMPGTTDDYVEHGIAVTVMATEA